MKLAEWLKQEGLSVANYALRRGFGHETVRRHNLPATHRDFRLPSRDYMLAYYGDSGGRVRPDDFYDLPELRAVAA